LGIKQEEFGGGAALFLKKGTLQKNVTRKLQI